MCGANCWTDHRLIIFKLNIHIQPQRRPQGQRVAKRLDVSKLECSPIAQELVSVLDCKPADLQANSDDIEKDWETLKTSVHSTTLQVLDPATRNHPDWFDENDAEIQKLLEEKCQLLIRMTPHPHQRRLPLPASAALFRPGSSPYKMPGSAAMPMRSRDLLTDTIPKGVNPNLDIPPSVEEVAKAFKQMSSGKAPALMPSLPKYSNLVAQLSSNISPISTYQCGKKNSSSKSLEMLT
ncbi:hypothetical protein Pcinc_023758 [Petrolisthes cinctipes]|uniref:Uncharacterized protein n=1 Tax=Petrolisthes cinctipes TaxID=88211 RepID=A0AAE1FDQ6_PETCI|nr:hypothetical protein Pcinc_023758 [Petrolisthes cinctipes]